MTFKGFERQMEDWEDHTDSLISGGGGRNMDAMLGSPIIPEVMVTNLDITNRTCDLLPITQFFEYIILQLLP